jgi:hypothetical protein
MFADDWGAYRHEAEHDHQMARVFVLGRGRRSGGG